MISKFIKKRVLVLALLVLIIISGALLYSLKSQIILNRTARHFILRITQVEILTKTRNSLFKFTFDSAAYTVTFFNKVQNKWDQHAIISLPQTLSFNPEANKIELLFYKGKLLQLKDKTNPKVSPQYAIITLAAKPDKKDKKFIFFNQGEWKILN